MWADVSFIIGLVISIVDVNAGVDVVDDRGDEQVVGSGWCLLFGADEKDSSWSLLSSTLIVSSGVYGCSESFFKYFSDSALELD